MNDEGSAVCCKYTLWLFKHVQCKMETCKLRLQATYQRRADIVQQSMPGTATGDGAMLVGGPLVKHGACVPHSQASQSDCSAWQVPESQKNVGENHAVSGLKFRILRRFLDLGYAVLLSDVDIVTLQNPFQFLARDCDVESMSDGWDNATAYGQHLLIVPVLSVSTWCAAQGMVRGSAWCVCLSVGAFQRLEGQGGWKGAQLPAHAWPPPAAVPAQLVSSVECQAAAMTCHTLWPMGHSGVDLPRSYGSTCVAAHTAVSWQQHAHALTQASRAAKPWARCPGSKLTGLAVHCEIPAACDVPLGAAPCMACGAQL